MPAVLTAAEMLTSAAEHGGPVEFARIVTLQALNRHVVRTFNRALTETRTQRRGSEDRYSNGYWFCDHSLRSIVWRLCGFLR